MLETTAWHELEISILSLISRNRDLLEDETDPIKIAKIQGTILAYRTVLQTPYLIIENCDKKLKSEIEEEYNEKLKKIASEKRINAKF